MLLNIFLKIPSDSSHGLFPSWPCCLSDALFRGVCNVNNAIKHDLATFLELPVENNSFLYQNAPFLGGLIENSLACVFGHIYAPWVMQHLYLTFLINTILEPLK